MLAVLALAAGLASANGAQVTVVAENVSWGQTWSQGDVTRKGASDLTSPDDFRTGNAYMKVNVTAKPSSRQVGIQMCSWDDNNRASGFARRDVRQNRMT